MMGPIAVSAFEVYQQQAEKRLKKKAKRIQKQNLQQQLSVSGVNGSPNGNSSLNRVLRKVESKSDGTKPQGIIKAKAKALKRLSSGVSMQRPARQLPKKPRESSSETTDDTSADMSFDSPVKKARDDSGKKLKDDSGKKYQYNSGKKYQYNSGKKYQDDSDKKLKDDSGKKLKDDSGKKLKDDSGKKLKDDFGKKAKNDFGKKANTDSSKKAEDGSGGNIVDSSGEKVIDDSGKKTIDGSGKKGKNDFGKKANTDSSKKAEDGSGGNIIDSSGEKVIDDSGKKTIDGSGKKGKNDFGKKAKNDTSEKVKNDSGKAKDDAAARKAKAEIRPPLHSRKRRVIESDSESASEDEVEIPPKQTEKRRRTNSENEVGKIPKFLVDEDIPVENSTRSGREVLQWLLTPILIPAFLEKYWEQRPLYISRSFHRDFFDGILSSEDIDTALRENSLQFTKNVDVTSYIDGVRETHNPVGRAHAFTVWDYYRNGCSVRLLNPQTYFKKLRKLCTSLQECFNSFVGANVYLTPPNSQGFAPHYDDIEAFVLQLEGKKKWKVYQPRKGEKLPRVSSRNFTEEEMTEPLLEMELQPGDLLYMPRGFIHQACTVPGSHSLHVTISTYQHSSWADVMEKVTSAALAAAIENDPEFREGVPWDFFHNMGLVFSTDESSKRIQIEDKIQRLFTKLIDYAPLDAAADQLAKDFIHESLPPMLQSSEVSMSVHGDGVRMKDGDVGHLKQLTLEHSVKLVRKNVLRMVSEADEDGDDDDTLRIYHCAENPLVYKEDDIKWCRIHVDSALAIETLIRNYPKYTRIADLPAEDDDQKLQMIMSLWERGILISDVPVTDVSVTDVSSIED